MIETAHPLSVASNSIGEGRGNVFLFFFFKKKKERKSNNIVMDKLIWLLLKKRILRKAVNLEIEEINQQRFPAYLSTYLST